MADINATLGKQVAGSIKNVFVAVNTADRTLAAITETDIDKVLSGEAPTGIEFILIEPFQDNAINRTIEEEKSDIRAQSTGLSFQVLTSSEMKISGQFGIYAKEKWAYQLSGLNSEGHFVNRYQLITSDACGLLFVPSTTEDGQLFKPWTIDETTAVAKLDPTKLVDNMEVSFVMNASFTLSGDAPIRGNLENAAQITIEFMPKNSQFKTEQASFFTKIVSIPTP